MYSSGKPATRLCSLPIGTKLKLPGDPGNRTLVVKEVREDGLIELYCNDKPNITACGSTIVSPIKT